MPMPRSSLSKARVAEPVTLPKPVKSTFCASQPLANMLSAIAMPAAIQPAIGTAIAPVMPAAAPAEPAEALSPAVPPDSDMAVPVPYSDRPALAPYAAPATPLP
ncbi:hypothetical protein D3C72_514140 [compost metagenome]